MYIKSYITSEYTDDILKFREKYYDSSDIMTETIKNNLLNNQYNNYKSCIIFVKGEIKAYILFNYSGKAKTYGLCYYMIDEIVCSNPKYLYILASTMSSNSDEYVVKKTIQSTQMLKMLEKKNIVKIKKQNASEDILYFKTQEMTGIRSEIYSLLNQNLGSAKFIIEQLWSRGIKIDEIKRFKRFILTESNNYYIDKYSMIGNTLMMTEHEIKIYSNVAKVMGKYKESGYEEGYVKLDTFKENLKNVYDDNYKRINVCKSSLFPLLEPMYIGRNVSYFRGILNRQIRYYRKTNKSYSELLIYDKYGVLLENISFMVQESNNASIPYNCSNTFDYAINNVKYKEELNLFIADLTKKYPSFNYDYYLNDLILKLKKKLGKEVPENLKPKIIEFFEQNKDDINTFSHDYIYPRMELLDNTELINSKIELKKCIKKFAHPFLTNGALKNVLLNFSTNKILKINKYFKLLEDSLNKRNPKIKDLRKQISKAVKNNDLDLVEKIVNNEVELCELRWKKTFKINKEDFNLLSSYIKRLNAYKTQISMKRFCANFKTHFKNMIKGEYPGLFNQDIIYMDYKDIGDIVSEILSNHKGDRKTRKFYTALNNIQKVSDIVAGNIDKDNYQKIITELKQRKFNIPKNVEIADEFIAKIEQKCSPEFLIAGDASVCCMSYGTAKATTYALEEGFGILNIYYKNRIIANSLIWINEAYNCLVIDNIEVAPNYKKDYIELNITQLYLKSIKKLLSDYNLSYAVQGHTYNDLKLYDDTHKSEHIVEFKPVKVKTTSFYSDARIVYPIEVNKTKEEILENIVELNKFYTKKLNKNASSSNDETMDYNNVVMEGAVEMDTAVGELRPF